MNDSYAVSLTHREACYLSDQLAAHVPPEFGEGFEAVVLKVGAAFLETEGKETACEMRFCEGELWNLWAMVHSSAQVGHEQVGYNLLKRFFRGLLELSAQADVHAVVTRLGETDATEPMPTDVYAKVEEALTEIEAEVKRGKDKRTRKNKARRDAKDRTRQALRPGPHLRPTA